MAGELATFTWDPGAIYDEEEGAVAGIARVSVVALSNGVARAVAGSSLCHLWGFWNWTPGDELADHNDYAYRFKVADRANAEALADKILATQIALVHNAQNRFGARLHSFSMSDDWGTQQAAFISKALWDDFFLPRYTKLFAEIHQGGQDIWVHTCGKGNEIIAGFITAGVDVVNLQQPRARGIAPSMSCAIWP